MQALDSLGIGVERVERFVTADGRIIARELGYAVVHAAGARPRGHRRLTLRSAQARFYDLGSSPSHRCLYCRSIATLGMTTNSRSNLNVATYRKPSSKSGAWMIRPSHAMLLSRSSTPNSWCSCAPTRYRGDT